MNLSPTLAWDTLTPDMWTNIVAVALSTGDIEAIPGLLALCATHGHPEHAEFLRETLLVGLALNGGGE